MGDESSPKLFTSVRTAGTCKIFITRLKLVDRQIILRLDHNILDDTGILLNVLNRLQVSIDNIMPILSKYAIGIKNQCAYIPVVNPLSIEKEARTLIVALLEAGEYITHRIAV